MNEIDERGSPPPEESVLLSTAEKLERRGFLRKLIMGATGLAAALIGMPQKAEALVHVACCWLCNSSTSCTGTCCWTWGCCHAGDNDRFYYCKECYTASQSCSGGCPAKCSQAIRTQFIC
jgi:hypothetical protein